MGLLSFSPETVFTINIIPGYLLGPLPVLVLLGLFLLVLSWLFLKSGLGAKLEKNKSDRLIILFFLFWLVLLVAFTASNYEDWQRNVYYRRFNFFDKKIIRVCGLGDVSGQLCHIFSGPRPDDKILQTYYDYYFFSRPNN